MSHPYLPVPENELRRLQILKDYKIMDSLPEQPYDDFVKLAAAICNTPIALITLLDDHRQWFKANVGLNQASETPRSHAFCTHAIMNPDEVMTVEDATLDERFASNPLVTADPKIRFYAGSPLITPTSEALGTICVIDSEPRQLTKIQLEALKILSREIMALLEMRQSIATLEGVVLDQEKYLELMHEYERDMEKVRLHLEMQSVTDVLTGVENRRSFDLKLNAEYRRVDGRDIALSLVMIDIDSFKDFNDSFGHPAGDEALHTVARILQSELRDCDLIFRYGGEEFAVILPNTTLNGAFVLAERFRRAVQWAAWDKRAITISVGVASVNETMKSPTDLLQASDHALYHAKRKGRNRISTTADEN